MTIIVVLTLSPIAPILIVSADEVEFEESSVLGSDGIDFALSVAIDSQDNQIIVGYTNYPLFNLGFSGPKTLYEGPFYDRDREIFEEIPIVNAYDGSYNGKTDIFITKYSTTNEILWSTYLGGSGSDQVSDVEINENDEIILVGSTSSSDFPSIIGNNTMTGNSMGIVSKMSSDGNLLWSRLLGGNDNDVINALSIDQDGNLIVIGRSDSTDFPVKNAYQDTYIGEEDGAMTTLSKLNPDGELIWSTYFGGTVYDFGYDVDIASDNSIFITGWTRSADIPLINSDDNIQNGKQDAYVAKFSVDGELVWSTLLGGLYTDVGLGIAVDHNNSVIVTGFTMSSAFETLNAEDIEFNNGFKDGIVSDAFVTKYTFSGKMIFSTYLGGRATDQGDAVIVDEDNNIYLTGSTQSVDYPIYADYSSTPTFNFGRDRDAPPSSDIVLTKMSPSGRIMWSVYFGGEGSDRPTEIAFDSNNVVHIVGFTDSQFNFGPIHGPNTFSLMNMHESKLIIPDGFFPFIPYEPEEDTDQLSDQTLFKVVGVILLFLFGGSISRYLYTKYKERKLDEEQAEEYNSLHRRIETIIGNSDVDSSTEINPRIKVHK